MISSAPGRTDRRGQVKTVYFDYITLDGSYETKLFDRLVVKRVSLRLIHCPEDQADPGHRSRLPTPIARTS